MEDDGDTGVSGGGVCRFGALGDDEDDEDSISRRERGAEDGMKSQERASESSPETSLPHLCHTAEDGKDPCSSECDIVTLLQCGHPSRLSGKKDNRCVCFFVVVLSTCYGILPLFLILKEFLEYRRQRQRYSLANTVLFIQHSTTYEQHRYSQCPRNRPWTRMFDFFTVVSSIVISRLLVFPFSRQMLEAAVDLEGLDRLP